MRAGIITIGSELLYGRTLDTNFISIARNLVEIGISVEEHISVNDSTNCIADAFTRCLERYDLIISTGGLGPTFDDLTREGLAKALCVELVEDSTSLTSIYEKLASRKLNRSKLSKRQALLPKGAKPIPNPVGLAPGVFFESKEEQHCTTVFCLPGVPQEFSTLFETVVLPYLRENEPISTFYSSLKLIGIPEVFVSEYLETVMKPNIDVAINVDGAVATIHMLGSTIDSEKVISTLSNNIAQEFQDYVFSTNTKSIEEVVGEILADRGLSIGCIESCTGGMLSKRISDVAGSSKYFNGSVVTYSNDMKAAIGVSKNTLEQFGAVSLQTAIEMAKRGRAFLESDLAVSITGISGPTGGSDEKPVGTVFIAVDGMEGVITIAKQFGGSRDFNRVAATNYALYLLWKYLCRMQNSRQE